MPSTLFAANSCLTRQLTARTIFRFTRNHCRNVYFWIPDAVMQWTSTVMLAAFYIFNGRRVTNALEGIHPTFKTGHQIRLVLFHHAHFFNAMQF